MHTARDFPSERNFVRFPRSNNCFGKPAKLAKLRDSGRGPRRLTDHLHCVQRQAFEHHPPYLVVDVVVAAATVAPCSIILRLTRVAFIWIMLFICWTLTDLSFVYISSKCSMHETAIIWIFSRGAYCRSPRRLRCSYCCFGLCNIS